MGVGEREYAKGNKETRSNQICLGLGRQPGKPSGGGQELVFDAGLRRAVMILVDRQDNKVYFWRSSGLRNSAMQFYVIAGILAAIYTRL